MEMDIRKILILKCIKINRYRPTLSHTMVHNWYVDAYFTDHYFVKSWLKSLLDRSQVEAQVLSVNDGLIFSATYQSFWEIRRCQILKLQAQH